VNRDDLALYVMGEHDDAAALERALAGDEAARAELADEARFDLLLRDAAAAATFCPACGDLVHDHARCDACGAAAAPGGYRVERVLVANAHGRMYVARDADGKQVALKELAFVHAPTLDAIAAFEREAKLVRALAHPGIPRFVASFEEGEGVHARYYLAQELVVGQALDARLADHFYSEAEIVDLARRVLTILVYLQSVSPMIIHRDVKPANLIVRADGAIALVDFGAAHVQGSTAGSTTIGTFGYMPIEQLAGIVDATTDVYALGATLVHLLSRQEPWKVLHESNVALNVSRPLRAFVNRLVAKDPNARFRDAATALAALDTLGAAAPRRKRWATIALAGAAAVAVGGGVAGLHAHYRHANDAEPEPTPAIAPVPVRPAPPQPPLILTPVATASLPAVKTMDIDFDRVPLVDALLQVASSCEYNLVAPASLDAKVTMKMSRVGCDQGMTALLDAHDLSYVYRNGIVRVASRAELVAHPNEPVLALGDSLPARHVMVTYSAKQSVHEVLEFLAGDGGKLDLVFPKDESRIAVRFSNVSWREALDVVLAAESLGYRYDKTTKQLVVTRTTPAPPAPVPTGTPISDSLSRIDISEGLAKAKGAVMACGKRAPDAHGIVKVHVEVAPDGRVASATISATPDDALGECVVREVKKATFAKTTNGGSFTYPYKF
jgi:hypothetical protein